MKKIFFIISVISILLFSGCVNQNMTQINHIEKNEKQKMKKDIKFSVNAGYYAYIDRDNKLRFICITNKCNYYDYKKHSYLKGTPQEEHIYFGEKGYYPPVFPSTKGVKCGTGSLWGWLAIFGMQPFGIRDYTKIHPIVCNTRFTKIDSTLIAPRIGIGLVTFGTPLLTGGTLHTVKFDKDEFINAIYESNLETFRNELVNDIKKYHLQYGIDVIYLEIGDIKDNLEDKYQELLTDKSIKDGVIFLDNDTNNLLAIDIFAKYKTDNLIKSISLQIEDILNNVAKNNMYVLKYSDIQKYIPAPIKLPTIPPAKKLKKSEFETTKQFNERVKKAVQKREEMIRKLQREYSLAVFERNTYIDSLEKAYKEYLENKSIEKNKLLQELKQNIPMLSKVLFLENTSGYSAKNFRYDADNQKLYFVIYSKKYNFVQNAVAKVPVDDAKDIKLHKNFKIIPNIVVENNKLILKGFKLLDINSKNSYDVEYTNINFKPEIITLRVVGMKQTIKKKINKYFKQFKQKNQPIVDTSKKEIWYIDVVKSINAKVPKWFSNPDTTKIIGYGEGKTLSEAKANARKELALMKRAIISSEFTSTKKINNFARFSDVKQKIKENTNVTLNDNEYRLYKQQKVDGIWYVGFEYIKPKK